MSPARTAAAPLVFQCSDQLIYILVAGFRLGVPSSVAPVRERAKLTAG
jgi:hypothetical protein